MKRRIFITWVLSVILHSALAQQVDLVVRFAETLQDKHSYAEAVVEYNRAIFLGADSQDVLFKNVADCYFQMGDAQLASQFYDKAFFSSNNDSLRSEIILNKAFSQIVHQDFMFAKTELYSIDTVYNQDQHKRLLFLAAFSEFGSENFERSKDLFYRLALLKDTATALQVSAEFDDFLHYAHTRRPKKVEFMSYIIPGSGQAYLGEWKESINSFALVGGLIYAMVRFSIIYAPIDGLMLFGPWVQRYYQGGFEKAHKLAHRRIQQHKNEAFNNLLDLCLDE